MGCRSSALSDMTAVRHAARLFSTAHFNDTFPLHTPPEVLNTPLEGVVLALKALSVDRVARFPFPTPPEEAALAAAQRCLEALGALERDGGALTAMGRAMARLPVGVRHARMIFQVGLLRLVGGNDLDAMTAELDLYSCVVFRALNVIWQAVHHVMLAA